MKNAVEQENVANAPPTAWWRRAAAVAQRPVQGTVYLAWRLRLGAFSLHEQAIGFPSVVRGSNADAGPDLARNYFPQ